MDGLTVPETIISGGTTYVHVAKGNHDMYVPQKFAAEQPAKHVWRYCVAKSHNNTVYFSNQQTQESVWILPDITKPDSNGAQEGEEPEPMQVVGTTLSATARRQQQQGGAAMRSSSTSSTASGSSSSVALPDGPQPANGDHELGSASNPKESIRMRVSHDVKEALAARLRQNRQNTANNNNNNNPGAAAPQVLSQSGQDRSASMERRSAATGDGGGGGHSVRDRLAAWRASKAGGGAAGASNPLSIQRSSGSPQPAASDSLHATMRTSISPAPSEISSRPSGPSRGSAVHEVHAPDPGTVSYDIYEEKRREYLLANADLQREREELLVQQRLAMEQARRLQETQAKEEAECREILQRRKVLEEKRLQLEEQKLQKRIELLAAAEAEAAKQKAAVEVNNYVSLQRAVAEEVERQHVEFKSYAETVAETLMNAARENGRVDSSGEPPDVAAGGRRLRGESEKEYLKRRLRELMVLSGDINEAKLLTPNSSSRSSSAPGATEPSGAVVPVDAGPVVATEKPTHGTITYSAQFKYIGDVTGPAAARIRNGTGTFFYDGAEQSFYRGEWEKDVMHGKGLLSLPHVALEGEWRDNALNGPSTLQTKRLKGTGLFRGGVASGSAVVELDSNSTFAGNLKANRTDTPGALTLSNGDQVEWMLDSQAAGDAAEEKKASAPKFAQGTGRCRVSFRNGDLYLGPVHKFQLQGRGAFRFVEGHEYVGDFSHGFMHGTGVYRFANGNSYTGDMHKGMFHGRGTYDQKDKYVYEGEWFCGEMHGQGRVSFANGDVWEGKFENDRRTEGKYVASTLFQL